MISRYSKWRRLAGGFTLIELLVVISIISILASILLPSLTHAKDLAKEVACMSNQRAVGVAVMYYASENDSRVPSSETWINDVIENLNGTQPSNMLDCQRSNMPKALFCPCDTDPYPQPYMTGKMEVTSYFVNGAESDFAMGGGNKIKVGLFGGACTIDQIPLASSCMMLGETSNYGKVADLDNPAVKQAFSSAGASISSPQRTFHHRATSGFYHNGKMSIYFADGHDAMVDGKSVDTLPLSLWPAGAMMDNSILFFPSLSLPTSKDNPDFWGPGYISY